MASGVQTTAQQLSDIRESQSLSWQDAVRRVSRRTPQEVAQRIDALLTSIETDHGDSLPGCVQQATLEALDLASRTTLPKHTNPTLGFIESVAAAGPDDELYWFEILNRFEAIRSRAEGLGDDDKRLIVLKFRVFRAFEKNMLAEFTLEDVVGCLLTTVGDIRSRVCLIALKALVKQTVRKGRRKAGFETLDRPTHRVDSVAYELRPKAMKLDDVDEIEMAFRKCFTLIDGERDSVAELEHALRYLYDLRANGVWVDKPKPKAPEPPAPAPKAPAATGPEKITVACPNNGCGARFRVPAAYAGRRARCHKCSHVFDIPAEGH